MLKKPYPYPVGTIFVKESYKGEGGQMGDMTSLTVMIKRAEGYDPANGDWEYLMASPSFEVINQGKMEMCIGCHSVAADTDFIFWNSEM